MSGNVKSIALHDGNTVPQIGFGVWQVTDDVIEEVVTTAIDTGYRLIDTAAKV